MNPVFYHDGGRIQDADMPNSTTPVETAGWYFWTETWADYYGPYATAEHAGKAVMEYAKSL